MSRWQNSKQNGFYGISLSLDNQNEKLNGSKLNYETQNILNSHVS